MVRLKVSFLNLEPIIMDFKELKDFQDQLSGEWLRCDDTYVRVDQITKYEILKNEL